MALYTNQNFGGETWNVFALGQLCKGPTLLHALVAACHKYLDSKEEKE